jgi:dihydrofolate synthase/folylpolyglutamate synthase
MVNDKDVDQVLSLFPKNAKYYFCKANIPRGLDAGILKEKAQSQMLFGEVYTSVADAFENAKIHAQNTDFILITGSFFTVAEVVA